MEYDKKIDDRAMILNCLDVGFCKRKTFSSGYFTNCIDNYSDLSRCKYGKLTDTTEKSVYTYQKDGNDWFAFFLPDCAVKEEKIYRPYTMENFNISEFVVFREKSNPSMEYHVRYNGYRKYDNVYKVILGNISYTFSDLFEDFERLANNGEWVPFGVKE